VLKTFSAHILTEAICQRKRTNQRFLRSAGNERIIHKKSDLVVDLKWTAKSGSAPSASPGESVNVFWLTGRTPDLLRRERTANLNRSPREIEKSKERRK
jgi:hypothetical protein